MFNVKWDTSLDYKPCWKQVSCCAAKSCHWSSGMSHNRVLIEVSSWPPVTRISGNHGIPWLCKPGMTTVLEGETAAFAWLKWKVWGFGQFVCIWRHHLGLWWWIKVSYFNPIIFLLGTMFVHFIIFLFYHYWCTDFTYSFPLIWCKCVRFKPKHLQVDVSPPSPCCQITEKLSSRFIFLLLSYHSLY